MTNYRHCSLRELNRHLDSYFTVIIAGLYGGNINASTIRYQFMIIGNQFLLALKTRDVEITNKFLKRLSSEIPNRFCMGFNVVLCDPEECLVEVERNELFDLLPVKQGIDLDRSVCKWVVFGKLYTVRYLNGVYSDVGLGASHRLKLYRFGCPKGGGIRWAEYVKIYDRAYDVTPFEGCVRDLIQRYIY